VYYARLIRDYRATGKVFEKDSESDNSFLRALEKEGILKRLRKAPRKPRAYKFNLKGHRSNKTLN